ncbi:ABC transporter ATP-binding protein [Nonlabens marinus]|uniref:Polysaccharide ABC transporter, ATP-binding protein n=1 Tax=Nonlabens marinus S1-08 TaxID=1454201 RepID=W8VQ18_9FLAO|nr:ABC transporter ATP-binding protein [Nonlabens marinus]BAO55399.1 polysaccharide ABC transporter, ATP-binding protein [Nonlabens marinus S1-08]
MSEVAILVKNIGKQYRLGNVGTGTLSHDLNRWWNVIRGKEDPYLKIGETNLRDEKGDSTYVWALKDISFQVEKGEVLGIIGGNGAGKSTLLKILSQVTGPSLGHFKASGRIASLLEVGTGFHGELSGRENIYLNGTILGMTKAEINLKIDEIVSFSGVERYLDTPVKRYSSGMKVRLAFAVAAHLEPDILIVDEVLAVGDIAFQQKAIGKIQQVSRDSKRTVLFVSHDMESISRLCSRTIILKDGTISFIGETQTAIDEYSRQMTEKSKAINIEHRNDRKGLGQLRFKKLELQDLEGNLLRLGRVGKPLVFSMTIDSLLKEEMEVSIGVGIKNKSGEQITLLSSWTKGEILKIKDDQKVYFKIKSLALPEGDYQVDLFMENGTMGNDIQDHLENAFTLKVQGKDYYNSGQVSKHFKYQFYVDFKQEVR